MIHRDPKKPVRKCRTDAKQALVFDDRVYPMPRRKLTRELILEQLGKPLDSVLVRDLNSEFDEMIPSGAVDLALGNVFKVLSSCAVVAPPPCHAKPKFAFVVDDRFKITLTPKQSLASMIGLFGLEVGCKLFRDLESPKDEQIADGDTICFEDGPVFTVKQNVLVVVRVNNNDVKLKSGKITSRELKTLAIKQGVIIDLGCVLFAKKPDGSLGPAINDDECVVVKECLEFRCVAPDDNS